jgi:hypothetical protein
VGFEWLTTDGLLLAGKVLDFIGIPIALITGCSGVGGFVGAVYAWMSAARPDWGHYMGYGAFAGGVLGVLATVADYLL